MPDSFENFINVIIRYIVHVVHTQDATCGDGWETVSVEKEQWFTLVNQLHTLALLSLLINNDTDVVTTPLLMKLQSNAASTSLSFAQPCEGTCEW